MDTNLFGVINGLNTYVSSFQSRMSGNPSAIIITGSKQGITNPPGNAAYNASKAAVKTLAEHLSFDLKDTKTSVHLLVPGWTFTGLVSTVVLFVFVAPRDYDSPFCSCWCSGKLEHHHLFADLLPMSCFDIWRAYLTSLWSHFFSALALYLTIPPP